MRPRPRFRMGAHFFLGESRQFIRMFLYFVKNPSSFLAKSPST